MSFSVRTEYSGNGEHDTYILCNKGSTLVNVEEVWEGVELTFGARYELDEWGIEHNHPGYYTDFILRLRFEDQETARLTAEQLRKGIPGS